MYNLRYVNDSLGKHLKTLKFNIMLIGYNTIFNESSLLLENQQQRTSSGALRCANAISLAFLLLHLSVK